jgi:putative hydrolase of the HAD superfamily
LIKAIIFDLGNTLIHQERALVDKTFETLPFAVEVLTQMKKKYKLALITNVLPTTAVEQIHEILREIELFDFFDEIVVSSGVGYDKPAQQIFQIALKKLNVKPEEAVMVGNTISTDIFGGNRMGMTTVLLQPSQDYQRTDWERPDHIIHSLRELASQLN